jgi:hypothetical protein
MDVFKVYLEMLLTAETVGRMSEPLIRNVLRSRKESVVSYLEVLYGTLRGCTEKNHEKYYQESGCPNRDPNQRPP